LGENDEIKRGKPGIAPLRPPALATFRSWGIQQELVVPVCQVQKYKKKPQVQMQTQTPA